MKRTTKGTSFESCEISRYVKAIVDAISNLDKRLTFIALSKFVDNDYGFVIMMYGDRFTMHETIFTKEDVLYSIMTLYEIVLKERLGLI